MTMGANEDATDDGIPAEVITLTMDDVISSGPGNVVNEGARVVKVGVDGGILLVTTGAITDNSGLETNVVLDATMELDSVDNVDNGAEREDGFVEISEGLLLLLELACITDVMPELENENSATTLEDIDSWTVVIPVVNATTEIVCKKIVCESKLLDSAGLCRTVADERDEKPVDTMFVEEEEKMEEVEEEVVVEGEGVLNPAELRRIGASKDADKSEVSTVVGGNTCSDVALDIVLIDVVVIEIVPKKTAELADEVVDEANESIVGEAVECTTEIVEELVEISWIEIAIDCSVEVVDGMIMTEERAMIVKSEIIDEVVIVEDDVGMALVETATPKGVARTVDRIEATEDGVGTALEERLSALMMSAAFART